MSDAKKTQQILALLFKRYQAKNNGWACFAELRDAAGFDTKRTIDFFAINTWPSNGFTRVACEIKASRGDFMKELDHPEKRKSAESLANERYFVTASGVVKHVDEIPDGWGWLVMQKNGLKRKKIAKHHDVPPLPMSTMAVIAKRTQDDMPPFSKATWLLQGQEISVEQLAAAANAAYANKLDREYREKHRKLDNEFRRKSRTHQRLMDVIRRHFDLNYGEEPDPSEVSRLLTEQGVIGSANWLLKDIDDAIHTLEVCKKKFGGPDAAAERRKARRQQSAQEGLL